MRMGLCVIHKELIEELRQDIAAAFTCLSGLILRNESGQRPLYLLFSLSHELCAPSLAASIPSQALRACRVSHAAHSVPKGKAQRFSDQNNKVWQVSHDVVLAQMSMQGRQCSACARQRWISRPRCTACPFGRSTTYMWRRSRCSPRSPPVWPARWRPRPQAMHAAAPACILAWRGCLPFQI